MRVGYSRRYKERYQIAKEQVIKDRLGTLTGETRWFDLPEVPTMIELGYKDFVVDTFHCMRAPAGTPPEIVEKLANTCIVVLKEPAFRDKLRSAGFETIANGPDGLRRRIANDIQRYKTIIEKAGIGRV